MKTHNLEKRAESSAFLDTLMKRTQRQVAPYVKGKQKAFTDKTINKLIAGDSGSLQDATKKVLKATPNTRREALNGAVEGANWKVLPNLGGVKPSLGFLAHATGTLSGVPMPPLMAEAARYSDLIPGGTAGGAFFGAAKGAVKDLSKYIKKFDMSKRS